MNKMACNTPTLTEEINEVEIKTEEVYAEEIKTEEIKKELRRESFDEDELQDRDESEYPWAIFALGETEYAINSKYVLCFESLGKIVSIINAQSYSPGLTESRGDLIELIDLRALFNMGSYTSNKSNDDGKSTMMVVVEVEGVKRGILVDAVVSVEYVSQFTNDAINGKGGFFLSKYISRIARRDKLNTPLFIFKPESLNKL